MNFGVIRIPRNLNKVLIYFLLTYVIFEEQLISMLGFPSSMRYLNDAITLYLLLTGSRGAVLKFRQSGCRGVLWMILLYSAGVFTGLILHDVPILQVFWAIRNTYRFFAFFVVCVCTLEQEDVSRLLNWLCKLQWLNLLLSIYEFAILKKSQDYLGGIFGTSVGCNAYLNVYLCIVTVYVVCQYFRGQRKMSYVIVSMLSSMVISGLSELKIFYIELLLIIVLAAFLCGRGRRILPILLVGAAAIAIGLLVLRRLFPEHFQVLMNLDNLLNYGNSQSGGYNLSRFHAFSNIDTLFFHNDSLLKLFGFGFGGCEFSAYDFLTSTFYRTYGAYNYRWFAHQMIYLETGYVGIVSYIAILAFIGISAWGSRKWLKVDSCEAPFVVILSALTVLCLWYNAATRSECAYLTYFALSAAAVARRQSVSEARDTGMVRREAPDAVPYFNYYSGL